jgi:uncharacterized membrane protein SirB2
MILKTLLKFLILFADDILVLSGLTFITVATFLLSSIAGLYVIGAILIVLAYVFAKNVSKRR